VPQRSMSSLHVAALAVTGSGMPTPMVVSTAAAASASQRLRCERRVLIAFDSCRLLVVLDRRPQPPGQPWLRRLGGPRPGRGPRQTASAPL
jgi:hypothetical protein